MSTCCICGCQFTGHKRRVVCKLCSSLRETAERIIAGIPVSYRDGDEAAGRERTVGWLMDVLREFLWSISGGNAFRKHGRSFERGEAEHAKRLKEIREQWQRGMPNFKTACVEFSFAVSGKIDAIFAAMKERK